MTSPDNFSAPVHQRIYDEALKRIASGHGSGTATEDLDHSANPPEYFGAFRRFSNSARETLGNLFQRICDLGKHDAALFARRDHALDHADDKGLGDVHRDLEVDDHSIPLAKRPEVRDPKERSAGS